MFTTLRWGGGSEIPVLLHHPPDVMQILMKGAKGVKRQMHREITNETGSSTLRFAKKIQ